MSVISDREQIGGLSASLMNSARQDWMSLETLHTEMPLTEEFGRPPLPAFGGQVRCRAVYDVAVLDDPMGRRIIESCAEAGEQVRMLVDVPVKMKLADQATALLPLAPTGTAAALVIKAPGRGLGDPSL